MRQEIGETRNAIMEDDNRLIADIVHENSNRQDLYWIVLAAKPIKNHVAGKPVLRKFIKAYSTKPKSQVGMVVGEVDNVKGEIRWEVNLPQAPIDYDSLVAVGAKPGKEVVVETTTIPDAYFHR